jgi:hypothetical protein
MNPLDFVGTPDWRSAVLALAFAAPWLVLLAGRWLRRLWAWAAVVASAVLFPLSIAWVQVPIQRGINALYANYLPAEAVSRYLALIGLPLVLIAGLVQEVAKFGVAVAGLHLVHARGSPRGGLALGAASGAGYGAMEAFWTLNTVFAAGFTWATVQLAGPGALLSFVERFFAVMFHIGVASVAAYGYAIRRPWRYLLLAIVLHTLADYVVILLQAQLLNVAELEIVVAVIAVATLSAALWIRGRLRASSEPAGGA